MATHEPYGSAGDIPSIADMLQKIEGGKFLTRFIARDQRAKLLELEQQVREHVAVIDPRLGQQLIPSYGHPDVTAHTICAVLGAAPP